MASKETREGGAPPSGAGTFSGDIAPSDAWALLESDQRAVLVDVRTDAEWRFVGVPDLSSLGKEPLLVEWQTYPGGSQNPGFISQLKSALAESGAASSVPVIFICRSGGRSTAAARAAAAEGLGPTLNLAGGFEGDCDDDHHRGTVGGWKAAGLPWVQS
ncbi:MAG: rhodanese-like domain-containing protein [Alphaproteobacteria bacterium]|nr:rhodanese-like domain-containing protein [Alphaproteobacteria bacterium]